MLMGSSRRTSSLAARLLVGVCGVGLLLPASARSARAQAQGSVQVGGSTSGAATAAAPAPAAAAPAAPAAPAPKPAAPAPALGVPGEAAEAEGTEGPEDADAAMWAARDVALNEANTITGGSGLLRTQHAQSGEPPQFRLGLVTEW